MDIISIICGIMPLVIIILGVISCIRHIYEKAKRENERRLEHIKYYLLREQLNNAKDRDTYEELYVKYKDFGGNSIVLNSIGVCDYYGTEWKYKNSKYEIIHSHNCINCGAPMPKGTTKCEYCGTEYY